MGKAQTLHLPMFVELSIYKVTDGDGFLDITKIFQNLYIGYTENSVTIRHQNDKVRKNQGF